MIIYIAEMHDTSKHVETIVSLFCGLIAMSGDFEGNAAELIPADVRMISGCQDAQTSADVSNVSEFQLPDPAGRWYADRVTCLNVRLSYWVKLYGSTEYWDGNGVLPPVLEYRLVC
jgi:hypothetical protein